MTILSTYTSTVGPNHTIVVPESVPIGAKVTITIASFPEGTDPEEIRHRRFENVMESIKMAIATGFTPPPIDDAELKALIKRARAAKKITNAYY